MNWREKEKWRRRRLLVLRRDGLRCRFCGQQAIGVYQMSRRYRWTRLAAIVSVCGPCGKMCRMGLARHTKLLSRRRFLNLRIDHRLRAQLAFLTVLLVIGGAFWTIHWAAGAAVFTAGGIKLADMTRSL